MKNLYAAGIMWCLLLTAFTSFAQGEPPLNQQLPDKPHLFSNLPSKLACNIKEIEKIFNLSTDQECTIKLNDAFQLEGVVSKSVPRNKYLTSINIHLNNYAGAILNLSRIVDEKGTFSYTGRIISISNGDLLLLKKEEGNYFFVKQEQRFVMVE